MMMCPCQRQSIHEGTENALAFHGLANGGPYTGANGTHTCSMRAVMYKQVDIAWPTHMSHNDARWVILVTMVANHMIM